MSGTTRDTSEPREPRGEAAARSGPDAVTGQSSGPESGLYEAFLAHFSRGQPQVQAFIRSLVHDRTSADDVFQATSLTLWRKFSTFRADAEFVPWALGIARNEVLHHWRSRRRDRLVFSEAVLAQLADVALSVANEADPRQAALESCIEKLPERQRQLVALFYGQQLPAETIAVSWDRTVHAVYKALKVMRRNLMDCVDRTLAGNP
jgi:RNA polymerase sigma-70 factor (ECF subfamily)